MASIQTAIMLTDRVTNPIRNICNALNMTISNFERLQEASGDSMSNIKFDNIRAEINQANASMIQLSDEINNAANKQQNFNDNVNNGHTKMGSLVTKARQLVTAYAGIQTIKLAVGASDQLTQMTARVNMMNDGMQTTDQLIKQIYASAQDARGSFQSMSELVARIGNNAKDAFSNNQEVIAFSNIIQKQMNLAGASTQEASNAIIQLSQGLGSGVLRGEELNSVFEQAPNIIQSIADYLNVPIGKIRTMAAEGELTSDIVKNAVLASADEVNRKFNEMPMTWSQVWTSMKNTALVKFQPVLDKINQLANNAQFQEFANNAIGAMAMLATATLTVFNAMASAGSWVADNWAILSPIIYGVVTALGIYVGILAVSNAISLVSKGIKLAMCLASYAHAAATGAEVSATAAATAAQHGLNTALLACPLTWIVIIIMAVIVAFFMVIAVINKVKGTHISAVGVICGGINVVIATFKNLGLFVANLFLGIGNATATLGSNIVISFKNGIANVKTFWYGLLTTVLDVIGSICQKLNKLPFIKFDYSGVTDAADKYAEKASKAYNSKQKYKSISDSFNKGMNTFNAFNKGWATDAYSKGYNFGTKVENKVKSKLNSFKNIKTPSVPDASKYAKAGLTPIANNTKKTADNTSAMKDALDITSENIKYIRDFATQKAINRFTTTTIKVDMTNHNNLNSDTDIDGVVNKLRTRLEEEMIASAEGVH